MVMALEDIVQGRVMWLETRNWKFIGNRIIPVILYDNSTENKSFDWITDDARIDCDSETYNIYWRVWTEEPTDEQRRETPWN